MNPSTDIVAAAQPDRGLVLALTGRFDARGTSAVWKKAETLVSERPAGSITIDLTGIDYLDTSGAALVSFIKKSCQQTENTTVSVVGMTRQAEKLIAMADTALETPGKDDTVKSDFSLIKGIGTAVQARLKSTAEFVTFLGDIFKAMGKAVVHPGRIRWRDTLVTAEKAGADALPIVALISFIVGLVMAFQAAMPMKMFGAEIYVANLIGIAMVRELGPLMTAIILAGRSGSAFAAEIGTMKINEEIDALTTMGLSPVLFLMIPRIIAAVCITPLLTIFSNLIGIVGGSIVLISMGYPAVTYYRQITGFVTWIDFTGGMVKCFVFGILIAATGCIRGFQTRSGPSAVGTSTTSAVVTGITLIAVFDGIFSVVYYCLGI